MGGNPKTAVCGCNAINVAIRPAITGDCWVTKLLGLILTTLLITLAPIFRPQEAME